MEWISVNDRMPHENSDVLVIIQINNIFFVPFVCNYFNKRFRNEDDDRLNTMDYSSSISHWMPLPAPPK